MPITTDGPARLDGFDERGYLLLNEDVARMVDESNPNRWKSGLEHFKSYGHLENRKQREVALIEKARVAKMKRLESLFKGDRPHRRRGSKYDFLIDDAMRADAAKEPISANGYDGYVLELIAECSGGLLLDCGAGFRPVYYENVVNYEIADYETTDVIGGGNDLPFVDGAFDGVISIAVLEHVRDPFICAAELKRVLKPGGKIICCVPFLQPYHGYPHHYFNMTGQGLRSLFEAEVDIEFHEVIDSVLPIWSLTWIVQRWAAALPEKSRKQFLKQPVRALLAKPSELLGCAWVQELPRESNFELASATFMIGRKRQ